MSNSALGSWVRHHVQLDRPVTGEEFRALALQQIFGRQIGNVAFVRVAASYRAGRHELDVATDLMERERAQGNRARGIDVDASGRVAGADGRAAGFAALPGSPERDAVLAEVDRRFHTGVGDVARIEPTDRGRVRLWNAVRDEVLFQRAYLADLPERVRAVLRPVRGGTELSPADYERAFTVAKKVERLPFGVVEDYAERATGTTTDWAVLDARLDRFLADRAQRERDAAAQATVRDRLAGLERLYDAWGTSRTVTFAGAFVSSGRGAGTVLGSAPANLRASARLDEELRARGFAGTDDFADTVAAFEKGFAAESVRIAADVLDRYAGRLHRESERYRDPAEVAVLHASLARYRGHYARMVQGAVAVGAHDRAAEQARIPSQGHLQPTTGREQLRAVYTGAQEAAATELRSLEGQHPIFLGDADLPVEARIDKLALAAASPDALERALQGHIAKRRAAVAEAREQLTEESVWELTALMPEFRSRQGIRPDSVHARILDDRIARNTRDKVLTGIATTIVAIALAVVTAGAGTPAVIAASAGVAGLALGLHGAFDAYRQYTRDQAFADLGWTEDPTRLWLVLAVVGAAVDAGAAVKALRAIVGAVPALRAAGGAADETRRIADAVRLLRGQKAIEDRVAVAVERAVAAREGLSRARQDLARTIAAKAYSIPGPLADPEFYAGVLDVARHAVRVGIRDLESFLAELRAARSARKLAELTAEELATARRAWAEAQAIEAAEAAARARLGGVIGDAARLEELIGWAGDARVLDRLVTVFGAGPVDLLAAHVPNGRLLRTMLEHIEERTARDIVSGLLAGKDGPGSVRRYLENLAAGTRILGETAPLGPGSRVLDSNLASPLRNEADPVRRAPLNPAGRARDEDLARHALAVSDVRVPPTVVGEVGHAIPGARGFPLVVGRNSAEYHAVRDALEKAKVGTVGGHADRSILADVFLARTEPGVTASVMTSDRQVVKTLARMGGIDPGTVSATTAGGLRVSGFPALVARYGANGFPVSLTTTVPGGPSLTRTIMVIPVP